MTKNLLCIDIFAGCGGLALGFFNSKKWKGVFAIEKNKDAFSTLKYNLITHKKHYNRPKEIPCNNYDINIFLNEYKAYLKSLRGKIDLVMGGPPCQGFSMAGKRKHDDVRNNLVKSYLDFVKIVQPKAVFFENVTGFTRSFKDPQRTNYSNYVIEELQKLGYDIQYEIVDFSEYGVPQKRKRFILTGFLKSYFNEIPDFFGGLDRIKESFLKSKGLKEPVTVCEAIGDLLEKKRENGFFDEKNFYMGGYGKIESEYQVLLRKGAPKYPDSHRFPKHNDLVKERFSLIIKENMSPMQIREKFGLKKNSVRLLSKNLPAPTLTTLPDDCIHYCEPRILTVREYARIQSFNDWFEFKGKYTTGGKRRTLEVPRYTQIGNAIPPLFGEIAAIVLYEIFRNNE